MKLDYLTFVGDDHGHCHWPYCRRPALIALPDTRLGYCVHHFSSVWYVRDTGGVATEDALGHKRHPVGGLV